MPAGHLPSQPMEAARLFPEPAAGEPYTILIMLKTLRFLKSPVVIKMALNDLESLTKKGFLIGKLSLL
jgi:hypothetical protein